MGKFLLSVLLFFAFFYLPRLIVLIISYFTNKKQEKGE